MIPNLGLIKFQGICRVEMEGHAIAEKVAKAMQYSPSISRSSSGIFDVDREHPSHVVDLKVRCTAHKILKFFDTMIYNSESSKADTAHICLSNCRGQICDKSHFNFSDIQGKTYNQAYEGSWA